MNEIFAFKKELGLPLNLDEIRSLLPKEHRIKYEDGSWGFYFRSTFLIRVDVNREFSELYNDLNFIKEFFCDQLASVYTENQLSFFIEKVKRLNECAGIETKTQISEYIEQWKKETHAE